MRKERWERKKSRGKENGERKEWVRKERRKKSKETERKIKKSEWLR